MKKLNNKGIGHHLLIIIVAVVAVVGAAGYFVWQRQKDNNIEAKAAGYTAISSINSIGGLGGGWVPQVSWYACKRSLPNGSYSVSVIAKSTTKERPTVGVGYSTPTGTSNGKAVIVYEKYMSSTLNIYQFPNFTIPSANSLDLKITYSGGLGLMSYSLSNITTC